MVADRVTAMFLALDEEVFFTKGCLFLFLETTILLAKPFWVLTVGFEVGNAVFFFSGFLAFAAGGFRAILFRFCAEESVVAKAKTSAKNNEALNILLGTTENLINNFFEGEATINLSVCALLFKNSEKPYYSKT